MAKVTECKKRYRNVVGPQIARARSANGLTQDALAAKLQILGLESIDNIGVSKIENQVRSIYDYELQLIAQILGLTLDKLYPPIEETKAALEDLKKGYRNY